MSNRTYEVKPGLKLPSVTTILDTLDKGIGLTKWICNLGWVESRRILKESGERGTRIHKYCAHKVANGEAIELDESDMPYAMGVDRFHEDIFARFEVACYESELTVFCERCGYAGTLDYAASFKKLNRVPRHAILDWKTSSAIRKEVALQLAAYSHAYYVTQGYKCKEADKEAEKLERWCFRFTEDGGYEARRYRNYRADITCFRNLLGAYNWGRSNP